MKVEISEEKWRFYHHILASRQVDTWDFFFFFLIKVPTLLGVLPIPMALSSFFLLAKASRVPLKRSDVIMFSL